MNISNPHFVEQDSIRDSNQQEAYVAAFSVTRIDVPGCPTHLLAIQNERAGVLTRVLAAQAAWGLSVRQTRVLELVASGASNKEIAKTLACSEATTENHITELFRRSGARSRAGLVGRCSFTKENELSARFVARSSAWRFLLGVDG